MFEKFKSLSLLVKFFIIVVAVFIFVVFFALGRKVWLWVFPKNKDEDIQADANTQAVIDTMNDSANTVVSSGGLTITDARAVTIADELEGLMNGWGSGFNDQYTLLAPLNKQDRKLVYFRFSVRDYSAFFWSKDLKDLRGWWVAELDSVEMNKMKELYQNTGLL